MSYGKVSCLEAIYLGGVYFFVLGGDHERSDAHELQALARDLLDRQKPVDEVDGEEESLMPQLELEMHLAKSPQHVSEYSFYHRS